MRRSEVATINANDLVSIHAPVWGATAGQPITALSIGFQSTHPCGVRQGVIGESANKFQFQSTHPCGVRPQHTQDSALPRLFQSTHPCGVRPPSFGMGWLASFNPRTRVGCDQPIGIVNGFFMFQSTHPCGVRQIAKRLIV